MNQMLFIYIGGISIAVTTLRQVLIPILQIKLLRYTCLYVEHTTSSMWQSQPKNLGHLTLSTLKGLPNSVLPKEKFKCQ